MTRKLFATFAIAAIAASMIAGCDPKPADATPSATDTVKTEQAPKTDATATPPMTAPAPGAVSATPAPATTK